MVRKHQYLSFKCKYLMYTNMNTNENDFNMKMKHGLRDDANGEIRQGLGQSIG